MPPIRRLNQQGIEAFTANLASMREKHLLAPPAQPRFTLLEDPSYSEPLPLPDVEIEHRFFANRREFARYLDARFQAAGVTHDVDIPGMWEWLTLFSFNEVCNRNEYGGWDVKDDMKYVLVPGGGGRSFRHLLREPYMTYRKFRDSEGKDADTILNQPLNELGDVVESICSRERIHASKAAMRVAKTLFYNPETDPVTRGAGGLRDYCKFIQNLPSEFNVAEISELTILAVLPRVFQPLIQAAGISEEVDDLRTEFGTPEIKTRPSDSQTSSVNVIEIAQMLQRVSQRRYSERKVAVRNDNFRIGVRGAYQNTCAISGIGLVYEPSSESVQYEVQAAHIKPIAAGGLDTIDNGIALTGSIHWAFDRGMIWVAMDDRPRVRVSDDVRSDRRNEWLLGFDGHPLRTPSDQRLQPSIEAINWHASNVAGSPH